MGYEERGCSREQHFILICRTILSFPGGDRTGADRPAFPDMQGAPVSLKNLFARRFRALVDCYRVDPPLRSISSTTTHRWGSRNGQTNPLRPKPIEALRKPDTSAYQIRIDVFLMKLRLLTPRPTPKKTPEVFITEFSSPLPC